MHKLLILWDPYNLGLALIGVLLFSGAVYFEAFEEFYQFSRAHEDLEIDEILTGMAAAASMLPVFLFRWNWRLVLANRAIALAKDRADHVALHDPLTGLHNRRYLQLLTENGAKQGGAAPQNTAMSVLLIDLDRFKPINDLRGHDAGDDLLRQVAKRLIEVCSDQYQVIRLGGDEFAVLTTAAANEQSNSRLARRLQTAISTPFYVENWTASISCSIGIATWADGMSASDLLRNADQAMYRAKALGRGTYVHFDDELGAEVRDQAGLEADFRLAVE